MAMEPPRFEVIRQDRSTRQMTQILRDRETGVCYVFHLVGDAGGLTPLLSARGTPIVEPVGDTGLLPS